MTGVLIVDVPQRERRVAPVVLGERLHEPADLLAVGRAAGTVMAARTVPQRYPVGGHWKDLRVDADEPRRRGSGWRGEVDGHALCVQQLEHAIEPPEVIAARRGLQLGPGEDADRYQVDARRVHQLRVLAPHLLGPLLRVVVATEEHVRDARDVARPPRD